MPTIDWTLMSAIVPPIVAAFLGAFLEKVLKDRPKLITHYGHVSSFTIGRGTENESAIHTHAVVIKNVGRQTATNIRVGHNYLPPDIQVFPNVDYNINKLPAGGAEIVFPLLVENEVIFINYLYYPPLTYDRINTFIKCDQGQAKVINVFPTEIWPKWATRLVWALVVIGTISTIYGLIMLAKKVFSFI